VARPAREVLFTVVPPSDRYKAKTFIDTVIYRVGDQLGAWVYAPLAALGAGVAGISGAAVVLAALSAVNAVWLGRKMRTLSAGRPVADLDPDAAPVEPAPGL
jgi:AAA family ATP:ADP antiporter